MLIQNMTDRLVTFENDQHEYVVVPPCGLEFKLKTVVTPARKVAIELTDNIIVHHNVVIHQEDISEESIPDSVYNVANYSSHDALYIVYKQVRDAFCNKNFVSAEAIILLPEFDTTEIIAHMEQELNKVSKRAVEHRRRIRELINRLKNGYHKHVEIDGKDMPLYRLVQREKISPTELAALPAHELAALYAGSEQP